MPVKIKLKRFGKIHSPQYRVVVADSRTARNGRAIEEIGIYRPLNDPSLIQIDADRVAYWLGVGAQPTEPVMALLKVTGDWQKYKGLDGASGTLKVAEPKQGREEYFAVMVAQSEKDKERAAKEPPEVVQPRKKKSEPEAAAEVTSELATEAVVEAEVAAEVTEAVIDAEVAAEVTSEPATEAVIESAPEETPATAEESPKA